MSRLRSWIKRLSGHFNGEGPDREFAAELQSHLQMAVDENLTRGMNPDEAKRAAIIKLGGITQTRELHREQRRIPILDWLSQDVRYAFRMFGKTPSFTLIAVLTLALGIGANSLIFSVVNAILLQPLPFKNPQQIVRLQSLIHNTLEVGGVSYPDFLDWQKQSSVFQQMAVFASRGFTYTRSGEASRLRGAMVSSGLFPLLGVPPILGRWFNPREDKPGAANGNNAVVLSDHFWRERFGGDRAVLGRVVELDNKNFIVVGVMPPGFQFPIGQEPVDLWTTVAVDASPENPSESMLATRGMHYLQSLARLKTGVTIEEARAQMSGIVSGLNRLYPGESRGIQIASEQEVIIGNLRVTLLLCWAVVACVLLIACANLTALFLTRAASREREMAIRSALGAARRRIVQQLFVENILVSVFGGFLAVFVVFFGIHFLSQIAPEELVFRLREVRVDGIVLAFTAFISLLTALIVGLAPALQSSRINLIASVKEGGHSEGSRISRLRSFLVVGQISLTVILLVNAGLLVRSLLHLQQVTLGFIPDHVLSFGVILPDSYSPEREANFHQQYLKRIQSFSGIESAGAAVALPLSHLELGTVFDIEGRNLPERDQLRTSFNAVTPDYFRTMGIPLLSGRDFTERDTLKSEPVVIINDALRRATFGKQNPIGKKIKPGIGNGYEKEPFRTIVGVVNDVRTNRVSSEAGSGLFLPVAQCPGIGSTMIVVRTNRNPHDVIAWSRQALKELDASIPLFKIRTLEEYVSASIAQPRFNTAVLTIFAALSLILASIGLYGVISYSVVRKTHEIGIRLTLGARPVDILGYIMLRGGRMIFTGICIGLILSMALSGLISSLLFRVQAHDPVTAITVAIILIVVALLACYLPARRAMRVDPLRALRYE